MSSDSIAEGLTAASLETKWKSNFLWQERNPFNNRMRRAISWLTRAELERDDPDAAFIFHWIAFNALYADNRPESYEISERSAMRDYFQKIVKLDGSHVIYNSVWEKFSGSIRLLLMLDNHYVFSGFWKSTDWKREFEDKKASIHRALDDRDTAIVLNEMFDRLYVLRNQLIHGGATWQGSVNRSQVQDGAAIMRFLVPHFIDLMLDNPNKDWGQPRYAPAWAWQRDGTQQKA